MTNWPAFSITEQVKDNSLTLVNSHAILEVSGADAAKFLQGQCSADINGLPEGKSVPGAICTVKGRVVTSFIAFNSSAAILLIMPRELVPITSEYLKKYAVFYKVGLNQWLHPCVIANPQPANLPDGCYLPCTFQLGETDFHLGLLDQTQQEKFLRHLESAEPPIALAKEDLWLDSLLHAGWLVLNNKLSEEYLPHQLNLDLLGAINFKKGCYTGQEIIARMEYRGKSKKRLGVVKLNGDTHKIGELPADINSSDGKQNLGELIRLDSSSNTGLALLPIEMPHDGSFICAEQQLDYQLQSELSN